MKILIATDGSDFSRAAIEKCCRMLNLAGDPQIKIISVYEQMAPMATEPFAISAQYYQEMMDLARKQCETFAADSAEQIKKFLSGSNPNIETEVRLGAPARVIIDEAKDWNADLIVVGSHGRGFWGRLTLGSVSDAIVHHAPCSVLIARADSET
ncbi:MAG TPA: universal stress protein [Pyrinomonadaceae bacterium]|jgi:nucleotide-binding universal stress UspA family protein|nr:universal stress protein [Pyrinomonadaceae bacterium]